MDVNRRKLRHMVKSAGRKAEHLWDRWMGR